MQITKLAAVIPISIFTTITFFLFQTPISTMNVTPQTGVTTTPASTPNPTPSEIQELEQQKRVLELQNQINELKNNNAAQASITSVETQQTLASRDNFAQLMRYVFGGSCIASAILFIYLVLGLFGFRTEKPRYSNITEEMLMSFHKQALSELKWNSALSLTAAVVGATIIFGGVYLALSGLTSVAIASGAAGILTEAVALLFHRQTDKIRSRAIQIEDKLFRYTVASSIDVRDSKDDAKLKLLDA